MDKQQAIDGKQLVVTYVIALCAGHTWAGVYTSEYVVWTAMQLRGGLFWDGSVYNKVTLDADTRCLGAGIQDREGEINKSRCLSEYHLYALVCFVLEEGGGQVRIYA